LAAALIAAGPQIVSVFGAAPASSQLCVSTKAKPATTGSICRDVVAVDPAGAGTTVLSLPAGARACPSVPEKAPGMSTSACSQGGAALDSALAPTISRPTNLAACVAVSGKASDATAGCGSTVLTNGPIQLATLTVPAGLAQCPSVDGKDDLGDAAACSNEADPTSTAAASPNP